MGQALGDVADPERAAKLAEKLTASLAPGLLAEMKARHPEPLARVLTAVCGTAPYLASHLVRHPDWLPSLVRDDLTRPLERRVLENELDALLAALPDDDTPRVLREFKYRWLTRITVREASHDLVPPERGGEILGELSALADVLLSRALAIARERVTRRLGPAHWGEIADAGFVVLALGKLGGEELNYSSDVDLIYLYEAVPDALSGPQDQTPAAWFTRLAQEFGKLVTSATADGFLYRIDLDLRPDGGQGALVLSDRAFTTYYVAAAHGWEKAAMMKARPVAGDLELGWNAIRTVASVIYQASMDFDGVRRIQSLKEKIGASRAKRAEAFNVKLDPGGIRDVEFIAQAMQLLHGARIPQLRDRSTQGALRALGEVKLLPQDQVDDLLRSYRFLRRVENRLQMEEERQIHVLPTSAEARERLACSLGFRGEAGPAAFDAALAAERDRVLAAVEPFLLEGSASSILDLVARHEPTLLAMHSTRTMMEDLARHFAREIDASPSPALALNNLDHFIEGLGGRRFYYELLLDRPELVPRLVALFASSKFLSNTLANHPRLIEPVFDKPDRLLLDREELRADLRALGGGKPDAGPDDFEDQLAALRLFLHRQSLNIGLLDVGGRVTRAEVEGALSEVAEVILAQALTLARGQLESSRPPPESVRPEAFLVVGMGKLASRELSYGSDLDLIFLYDVPAEDPVATADSQEHFARLAQRMISTLQTPTAQGFCYEIDARLRPSGRQGSLVTSLAALGRYHERDAQIWERQVLLRARPVAGNPKLAADFESLRRKILERPPPESMAEEIHRVRERMETEIAGETRERRDLKTGRGGLLDVENAVQYLQLRHAPDHPELLEVARVEVQIARLQRAGLLAAEPAAALAEGWEFLQRLSNRLRIVENRSISELDEQRGDLDELALRLGYEAPDREAAPRRALLRDYAHHTETIRRAYLEILGPR